MTTAGDYGTAYLHSVSDPQAFWGEAAALVDWVESPQVVLDDSNPPFYRWFTGGRLNTCYNAVDRHVLAGHADRTAIIYDSAVSPGSRSLSYSELLEQVAALVRAAASVVVVPVVVDLPARAAGVEGGEQGDPAADLEGVAGG